MTLPVFLAEPELLARAVPGAAVELTGPEARHAVTVRRTAVGERVDLVDGRGRRVTGSVSGTDRDRLLLRVEAVEDEPAPEPRFVLVQALAKGDRDEQAVEAATELGVDRIVPWQARRSIVQWRGERGERSRRKWVDTVAAATKQSRRSRMPEVAPLVDLEGLVGLVATTVGAGPGGAAYLLHEDATTPLAGRDLPPTGEIVLIVGPEGGISPAEQEALIGAGALAVRLGPQVLRSSSAGPAALAVLSGASRWR